MSLLFNPKGTKIKTAVGWSEKSPTEMDSWRLLSWLVILSLSFDVKSSGFIDYRELNIKDMFYWVQSSILGPVSGRLLKQREYWEIEWEAPFLQTLFQKHLWYVESDYLSLVNLECLEGRVTLIIHFLFHSHRCQGAEALAKWLLIKNIGKLKWLHKDVMAI